MYKPPGDSSSGHLGLKFGQEIDRLQKKVRNSHRHREKALSASKKSRISSSGVGILRASRQLGSKFSTAMPCLYLTDPIRVNLGLAHRDILPCKNLEPKQARLWITYHKSAGEVASLYKRRDIISEQANAELTVFSPGRNLQLHFESGPCSHLGNLFL